MDTEDYIVLYIIVLLITVEIKEAYNLSILEFMAIFFLLSILGVLFIHGAERLWVYYHE